MFRNLPILAIAMTAGLAALLLSGIQPETVEGPSTTSLESDTWFI